MKAGKALLATLLAGAISILIAIFGQPWLGETKPPSVQLPDFRQATRERLTELPGFSLRTLAGEDVNSANWAGKVLVLHFWASWCQPCQRDLRLLQATQGVSDQLQVIGIAIDTANEVTAYLAQNPVTYPILLGGAEAVEVSRRLGNRLQALPFTVIFDHRGRRIHDHCGELTQGILSDWLPPLITQAAQARTS